MRNNAKDPSCLGLRLLTSNTAPMHLAMSWDREVKRRVGDIYPPNYRGCIKATS